MHIRAYRSSIIIAAAFTALISLFWLMPEFAFIFFIALLLSLLLSPIADRLARHMPRGLAAGLVVAAVVLLASSLFAVISSTFVPTLTRFVGDFPHIAEELHSSPLIDNSPFLNDEIDSLFNEIRAASVGALTSSLSMIVELFGRFIDMVIIIFVTFYFIKDGEEIKSYLAGLFPSRDYARVLALFNRILDSLTIYIRSQLIICLISGTIVFLYYTVRGLPYASVFAVLSGICEFIPVLGPTVASAFGVILTATVNVFVAAQTIIFYLILTQTNHNFVYPTLIGHSLNLHPVAIILGIIIGGELLGAAGMFLAVPVIVTCKLVIGDIYDAQQQLKQTLQDSRWLTRHENERNRNHQ